MKYRLGLLIINLLLLVTFSGCNNDLLDVDTSKISLNFSLERFDQELYVIDLDTIDEVVSGFYKKYGDFFDVYNVHVINIGPASHRHYGAYLSMFLNDPLNKEIYAYTGEVFKNLSTLESELEEGFKRFLVHFPDSVAPRVLTYIGGFNHKLFTVGNYIGVGLDQYLGANTKYYDQLNTPEYMQMNMHREKIPSDLAQVWGEDLFPYNDSIDNVLSRMIHNGLLLYFSDALFPEMDEALKVGFTESQMKFCKNNEKQMWTYLIEHELLFSTDLMEIKKLTDEAPTTFYFPGDSPGRAANWLGWQIVKEFAKRNSQYTLAEILTEKDYQKILRFSRYNP